MSELIEELEAVQSVFMTDVAVQKGEEGETVVQYLVCGDPVVSLLIYGESLL